MAIAGFEIPSIPVNSIVTTILYILIATIIVAIVCGVGYFIYIFKTYNKRIIIFKSIGNKVTISGGDKGKFERIGYAGDYWLKLLNSKKILPKPTIEINKNTFWYCEREDGEYINFGLEDINAKQKLAKSYFVDEDMRLQRLGIQKNLELRYNKESWWQKYGYIIMYMFTIIIIAISLMLVLNKINDILKTLPEVANALKDIAVILKDIYIQTNGGLVPANATIL